MLNIKISDIVFSIDYSKYENISKDMFIKTYLYRYLLEYVCESEKIDYTINISRGTEYIEKGNFISKGWYNNVFKFNNTIRYAFYQPLAKNAPCGYTYTVDISNDWSTVKIIDYVKKEIRLSSIPYIGLAVGLSFYVQCVVLRHNSFFIHGVALQYKNKNIVFSAASRVGKTTHTSFWEDKFGAEILNGDSPIIKLIDEKPYIYGSPWCGSSDITVNKNVPLDTIVVLSRGNENKIRKLSKAEAAKYLLPHIRRPVWDGELTNICLDYCEKIINTINIYHLECLPNEEAAEVALAGIEELHV